MIAAIAFFLLAEAASACSPGQGVQLGGGAVLVRPVGSFEAAPLERLGPTTSVRQRPSHVQQTGAFQKADGANRCEGPLTIA